MTAQLPSQQDINRARLMSLAPIGFQCDSQAYYIYTQHKPVERTPEENRAFYREIVNRHTFFLRLLPDLGPSDGLALTLWHLCTSDHEYIVLVSESPETDRLVIDSFLERVEPVFGKVMEGRRIKVVPFLSKTGLHGTIYHGKTPTLLIVNGRPELYDDAQIERWIEHTVRGAINPQGSLVMLGCPVPKPIEIELEVPADPEGDIKMVVDGDLYINGEKVDKKELQETKYSPETPFTSTTTL